MNLGIVSLEAEERVKESYKKITSSLHFHFTFNEKANWKIDSSKESLETFTRNVKECYIQNI